MLWVANFVKMLFVLHAILHIFFNPASASNILAISVIANYAMAPAPVLLAHQATILINLVNFAIHLLNFVMELNVLFKIVLIVQLFHAEIRGMYTWDYVFYAALLIVKIVIILLVNFV